MGVFAIRESKHIIYDMFFVWKKRLFPLPFGYDLGMADITDSGPRLRQMNDALEQKARLAALQQLTELDEELGLPRKPDPPCTPAECTMPPEWMSRPYWVDPPSGHRYGFPRLYDPSKDGDMTQWMVANGYPQHLADKHLPCTFTACTDSQ